MTLSRADTLPLAFGASIKGLVALLSAYRPREAGADPVVVSSRVNAKPLTSMSLSHVTG